MAKVDTIVGESELPALGKKQNPHPARRFFSSLFQFLLILLFTAVLAISGQITYDYTRYQTFFVNGTSMYPTLNKDVTFTDANGNKGTISPEYGDFISGGTTYVCDYGLMDGRSGFIQTLKRFDIVVSYFNEDMVLKSDGTYTPREKDMTTGTKAAALKIKRIIALPGEKFRFDSTGQLYINDTYVEQPSTIRNLAFTTNNRTHISGTLGSDEYFLCGDNRTNSEDSRSSSRKSLPTASNPGYAASSNGAIASVCLAGKAVAIIGKCSCYIANKANEEDSYHPLWTSFIMPWALKDLYEQKQSA